MIWWSPNHQIETSINIPCSKPCPVQEKVVCASFRLATTCARDTNRIKMEMAQKQSITGPRV